MAWRTYTNTVNVRANDTVYSGDHGVMLGTSDLNIYECTAGGASAGWPPSFNTNIGDSTTDGDGTLV